MSKKIRATERTLKVIRDTSASLKHVAPAIVEASLGADEVLDQKLEDALAPITLFAIRSELLGRLQSKGGRPALTGTSRRAKIPLQDSEWADLEQLATLVSTHGLSPTAGQIASILLSLSVRSVISQVARSPEPASSPLTRDLAARMATEPARRLTKRNI